MPAPSQAVSNKSVNTRTAVAWVVLGVIALALSLGTNSFMPVVRGLEVSSQIVARSPEYRQQIRENDSLESELAYLKTDAGKRQAVRKYLGLVEPGQQVGRAVVDEPRPPLPATRQERLRQWLGESRDQGAGALHRAWEVLACYTSRRPLDQPPES